MNRQIAALPLAPPHPRELSVLNSLFSYNHVTNSGFQYDAAGNMTHDASHSYTYDAENRVTQVDGGSTASYLYDPGGRRVQKVAGGVTTDYIRDLGGNVVAEVSSTCNYCWTAGYNYLGGQLSSIYTNSTTYFVSADHLGSTRLLTGYPTASVVECDDYYPFGEQISCGGTSTTTHKFTGYERDAESGLDNAQARYNSSAMGRFMSPDPVGNFVADATNPQTWNLYAYALNNPLLYVDPTGTDGQDYRDCIGSGNDPSVCGGPPIYSQANPPPPPIISQSNPPTCWGASCDAWSDSDALFLNFGHAITLLRRSRPDASWVNLQIKRLLSIKYKLLHSPYSLNWVVPIYPVPLIGGVGPAGDFEFNPETGTLCAGVGVGGSAGRNIAGGPLTQGKMFNGQDYPSGSDNLLSGGSYSGGYSSPIGLGVQGMVNGSGAAAGPTAGMPGVSVAATYSVCW